ncbi:transcriptional regulator [Pasteurellaceae bacterium LFhippo2]|nr:transcriptional regulator [Pasteurellaceae bacterium LFhippo2]
MNKAIAKAVEHCKTQSALAIACGVSQVTIVKWLNGGGIKAKYILRIVEATNGKVTAEELLIEQAKQETTD